MRKKDDIGFKLQKRVKRLGMALAMPVLMLMAGLQADAATKETPLVNLAKGKTTITSSSDSVAGSSDSITDAQYLTDGDKYYLEHNEDGNKVNGSWEGYNEKGAVAQGGYVWIQLDLGESYPIEVINLKRQNYRGTPTVSNGQHSAVSGTKITYQKTAIVIANEADFSDGYVVYYQDGADLPEGLQKPEASQTYVEPMGGQWFYMDYAKNKGLGATDLGTTKNARYIRVYTYDSGASSVNFMELGVYGYKNKEDIQETTGKRRIINEENPMMLATAYSDDVYAIGQENEPTLQGYNTVSGRCLATPDDLKEYSTLLLHTNNLRQFSPEHIGQANIQAFYEHGLQITYENDTPAILLGISASATPGGAHWYPLRFMDLGWLDLMYRMYPNMQGTLNTENYWSGAAGAVATNSAAQLEIAHRYGGYFIWADQDHGGYVESSFTNATWKEALNKYGESCFMLYKNTSAGADDMETTSYHQGHWLAGYTGGWGMLSDTWFWSNKNYGKLWNRGAGYEVWQKLCGVPEALIGAQMLSTYLGGGVIYTFEFPEVVYGVENTNSPAYTHVVAPLFRYFIENPAPTRAEILQETKVMLHGHLGSKDIYSGTAGTQTGVNVYETGRYGLIPTILPLETREQAAARLAQVAEEAGLTTVPSLMDTANSLLNGQGRIKYFQQMYAKEYEGNAFADKLEGSWYVYNSKINENVNQTATLPLEGGEGARIKATLEPHTYFILEEQADGASINMMLNNYRINKDRLVFDNPEGYDWSGGFAAGSGTLAGKLSVYNYMRYWNVVNANGDTQHSPEDNTLRNTTFELTKLAKAPTVTIVEGQQPDTDDAAQYSDPVVNFDQATGTATITITCNGWVNLKITDLEYATDDEYEMDLSDPVTEGVRENLALNQSVSHSAATSTTGRNGQGVDGTINTSNYADPGGNSGGAHWMQVDLAGLHEVEEVKLYRYWDDSRQYNDTVILLSPDSNFPADNTLVLWNANTDDTRTWTGAGNGQTGTHTLPVGSQTKYAETSDGKSIKVYDSHVEWLDKSTTRQKPEANGRFQARYVRVYMNGSGANSSNHIIELQVFGETGQVVLTDTEAPTVPSQLKQVSVSETGAVISFRPSVDNMGMKHYEVTYKKAGEETGTTVQVEEASVTLTGLEPNSQYEITVVAVDNFDNKSAASEALTIQTTDGAVVVPLTVTASVEEGSYTEEQQVTLTPSEEGGAIYYTLDGSDPLDAEGNPTANAVEYTTAITIRESTTLKAAMKKESRVSEVFSWNYEITTQTPEEPDNPVNPLEITVNVAAGSYTEAQQVTLTPSEEGGAIYYTLDGSDPLDAEGNPTANAVEYTTAITIRESTTLKAAMKKEDRVSEVFSWKYEITTQTPEEPDQPDNPSVEPLKITTNVKAGSYTEAQKVVLTPSEAGGEIYYTLDGTNPLDTKGNPTAKAVKYTTAVTIDKSVTLKAMMKKGDRVSQVFSWSYEITIKTPEEPDSQDTPLKITAGVAAGSYTTAQKVALTPSETGGEIYYTLDGTNPLDTKGNPTAKAVKYTAAVTIDKSVTLTAMMKKGDRVSQVFSWKYQVTSSTPTEPKFPFTDVPVIAKHWKYEAVKYVWLNNVMNGISGTTLFDPDSPLTRAMFATVLYRMADSPAIAFENKFTDVADGKYYSKAIIWANKQGIVSGFTDGSYGVSVNITREQIAKMLFEFAANRKFNTQGKASLESFTDQKSVSHWAVDYMCWAVDAGMISGKPNGDGTFRLDPKGEATRAECAKMLQMFMEKYF